jgi:hypothetical protein
LSETCGCVSSRAEAGLYGRARAVASFCGTVWMHPVNRYIIIAIILHRYKGEWSKAHME